MQAIESGSSRDNMLWCHHHFFVVNGDKSVGLHWFVCGMDCFVGLGIFTIWVWEPLSSIALTCPFLAELKWHDFTTNTRLWDSKRTVGVVVFKSLRTTNQVDEHRGSCLMFASGLCELCVEHHQY